MGIGVGVPSTAPVRVVPPVATVPEEMQERTGQEQEVRHDAKEVCTVLAKKKEGRDHEEPD
jgi:hypothetical protein